MDRVVLKDIPLRPISFPGLAGKIHWAVFVLFLAQWALVWARLWVTPPPFGDARWPDGLLVVLATATTVCSLARHLPGQNVMLASVVIAVTGGAVHALGALTALPFGPFQFHTEWIGQQIFYPLPWAVPMLWVVVILNARGVGRLILRPWRLNRNYGFWLLGLSVLLVVLLESGLEPYATQVKEYWSWRPTKLSSDWYTMPWVNLLGWGITSLLILAFVTPALINKRPAKTAPQYHPLVVWSLLNVLFLSGAARHGLRSAVAASSVQLATVAGFALFGARKARV